MLVGYARVSTLDQNLDLQRDALTKAGCERLFEEKKSGKAGTKRPEFEAALAYLRPTDVLVVWKLDRLGRSLVEMMRTIDSLAEEGGPLPLPDRAVRQRHRAWALCPADARRHGRVLPRPQPRAHHGGAEGGPGARTQRRTAQEAHARLTSRSARALLHSGTISIAAIAKRLGVSRDTFYSYFPQARARSQAAAAAAARQA